MVTFPNFSNWRYFSLENINGAPETDNYQYLLITTSTYWPVGYAQLWSPTCWSIMCVSCSAWNVCTSRSDYSRAIQTLSPCIRGGWFAARIYREAVFGNLLQWKLTGMTSKVESDYGRLMLLCWTDAGWACEVRKRIKCKMSHDFCIRLHDMYDIHVVRTRCPAC